MSKVLVSIALTVGILATPFFFGAYGNMYDKVIGTQHESVQRQKFKQNASYVEGKISDLAKYKREYEKEKDPVAKKSIANLIDEDFANFDVTLIENQDLYNFLQEIRDGRQ